MNDILKDHDAIFGGGEGGGQPAGDVDWKQRCEAAERELASARVEQGRVKKLDEEKKALEKQVAELRAARGKESILEHLSAEEKESVAPEVLGVLSGALQRQNEEWERRFRESESRRAADDEVSNKIAKEDFVRRVDSAFPGFMRSVCKGGQNEGKWKEYKSSIGRYVDQAYANLDFEGLSDFIRRFYREPNVVVPNASQGGSSAPDPNALNGGIGGVQTTTGKVYSVAEVSAIYDRIEQCRAAEDFKEANRLEAEIDKAIQEGRVK